MNEICTDISPTNLAALRPPPKLDNSTIEQLKFARFYRPGRLDGCHNAPESPLWEQKVAVVGVGAYGTALLGRMHLSGIDCSGFGRRAELVNQIRREQTHPLLAGKLLPAGLDVSANLCNALRDRGILILAVPSAHIPALLRTIKPHPDTLIISLAKGVIIDGWSPENQCLVPENCAAIKTPLQCVSETEGWEDCQQLAIASGPGFARNIIDPTSSLRLTVASAHEVARLRAAALFQRITPDVQSWPDPHGVEIEAAMKNVIALGFGILKELNFGPEREMGFLADGLREGVQIAKFVFGGKTKSALTYAGLDDLLLTALNTESRNHTAGRRLGRGESVSEIVASKLTAEGIATAYALKRMCDPETRPSGTGVYAPTVNAIFDGLTIVGTLTTPEARAEAWRSIFQNLFRNRQTRPADADPFIPLPFPARPTAEAVPH